MACHLKLPAIFTTILISSSIARHILTPTTPLPDNETLISASGTVALGYNKIPEKTVVWVANLVNPVVNLPGVLSITANGTLTIISLVAGVLLTTSVGCALCKRRRTRKNRKLIMGVMNPCNNKQFKHEQSGESIDLPIFDFDTIIAATNYFSSDNKLGDGGFGPVYKGKIGDDQEIAVKRLSKTNQDSEEFKNEVVLIAKLQHRNLVRVYGCCIHEEERMLTYEYLPNKSLDVFLFEEGKRSLLDWNTRYRIITGIARGLDYIHRGGLFTSRSRVIHRNLKARNILLDKEMIPKISDFCMGRIFSRDETDFNTRKSVDSYGYMSPEYAMYGSFSIHSDAFSFGVLVLEIISGKMNGVYAEPPHINLPAHAWSLWKAGNYMQLVDDSMGDSFSRDEVLRPSFCLA